MTVQRTPQSPSIPLWKVNQIEEGDEIVYAPSLRTNEKRSGEVAVVLVASVPQPDQELNFIILESKNADVPARWKAPFRASLAMYVYGPSGLSTRKLKGFLAKDQELVAQLADYAEKTAQTETVLQAIASYEEFGNTESLGAALHGFAGQYGISGKIDRNAPLNEQTLAALRTLNPALSSFDPISPSGSQRVSQTAGLAATVAGMFLGSTVGIAAGGTAMALNLKTLLFPDADFRSAYSQPSADSAVSLCTGRDPYKSRKRLAYLWAIRIPDSGPPKLTVTPPNHVPAGLKSFVSMGVPEGQWKLAGRIRNWSLVSQTGSVTPVQVTPVTDQPRLEINLSGTSIGPGKYTLSGSWDWDSFRASGEIYVDELGKFGSARLTPTSQNRLQQHSGKQLIHLTGADFQFVEKAAIVKKDDKYVQPTSVPFSLPHGRRKGPQNTLEVQIDATHMAAGDYSLLLSQADGKPHPVDVQVLPEPPKIEHLPIILNERERDQKFTLRGNELNSITGLAADGLRFELKDGDQGQRERAVHVVPSRDFKEGETLDLSVSIKGFAHPVVLAGALRFAGPRPRIRSADPSLPSDLQIKLRAGELPAGVQIGVMMQVTAAGSEPSVTLSCRNARASTVKVQAGMEKERVKLNKMHEETLFLSLDPGVWPGGCLITAVLEDGRGSASPPFEIGRVLRLPRIDDFKLTEESVGEGIYVGILTGNDLELVGKTGWDANSGHDVLGLPAPITGEGSKQSLRIPVPWPSPTPRAPLFLWFRGEQEGRATTIRY
ncbi:MAG TPA: hypothetical protein VEX68_30735 [Bryobacteraceae bacterium]|nr:hypothetical protein [Bryobacteraceae bacterium]